MNILSFGGDPTGATDNDTALANAWAALGARGGKIYFPEGRYKFANQFQRTLPNTRFSVTISGDGQGVTELFWPAANGGMDFVYSSQGLGNVLAVNNMTFDGLTFVTGAANGGVAIHLRTLGTQYQEFFIPTTFIDCSFVGLDFGYGSMMYWTQCNRIERVNGVKWTNCQFAGAILQFAIQSGGQGVYLGGGNYGVLYDFNSCIFINLDIGLIYGPGVQGVTVSQCNFLGQSGTAGIRGLNDQGLILAQLFVSDSQFDNGQFGIFLDSVIYDTRIVNCAINLSKSNGCGIFMTNTNLASVMGTSIQQPSGPTGNTGISMSGSGAASIMGCQFVGLNIGYVWDVGTNQINAQGNSFVGITGAAAYNFGSSPTPGTPHN